MKIAIHNAPTGFHKRWIAYCKQNDIPYKLVNCHDSDIMRQLTDCKALMWNHHMGSPKDLLMAKHLLFAVEQAGKVVFPDYSTNWHFDDKISQKYLLEGLNASLVPSYVFYDKKTAKEWIKSVEFPKVFKLRSGAGASSVRLVKTKRDANRLVRKAFRRGFSRFDRWAYLKERIRKVKEGLDSPIGILKGFGRLFITTDIAKYASKEKGYVYFQDFLPQNDYDIRIVVVSGKAFAIKRLVRHNDFRASGSGFLIYKKEEIDIRAVKAAMEISGKIGAQCLAYDFILDQSGDIKVIEISYAFSADAYDLCEGYWDENMQWHDGPFNPYGWMVDSLIEQCHE